MPNAIDAIMSKVVRASKGWASTTSPEAAARSSSSVKLEALDVMVVVYIFKKLVVRQRLMSFECRAHCGPVCNARRPCGTHLRLCKLYGWVEVVVGFELKVGVRVRVGVIEV